MVITVKSLARAAKLESPPRPALFLYLMGLQAPPYIQEETDAQHGAETWKCQGQWNQSGEQLFFHGSSKNLWLGLGLYTACGP